MNYTCLCNCTYPEEESPLQPFLGCDKLLWMSSSVLNMLFLFVAAHEFWKSKLKLPYEHQWIQWIQWTMMVFCIIVWIPYFYCVSGPYTIRRRKKKKS